MNKKVFITGASRGIGACLATELVKKGYQVIGSSRDITKIKNKIKGVIYVNLDMMDPQSIQSLPNRVDLEGLNILINNAGQSQIGSLEDTSIAKYKDLFQVNVFGVLELTQVLLPWLKKAKNARLINIGSLTGKFPLPYYSAYCGTKYAIDGMTQSISHELLSVGIETTVIHPNDIKTSISPEFLVTEKSDFYRGASKVREMVKSKMSSATPVENFVSKVMAVIESDKMKPAYYFGGNASFLIFIRRFMSDNFALSRIRKNYGM